MSHYFSTHQDPSIVAGSNFLLTCNIWKGHWYVCGKRRCTHTVTPSPFTVSLSPTPSSILNLLVMIWPMSWSSKYWSMGIPSPPQSSVISSKILRRSPAMLLWTLSRISKPPLSCLEKSYELPDGQVITIGNERYVRHKLKFYFSSLAYMI